MIKKIKQKTKKVLIWSQKYTQTDMVYLAKGGFWLSLEQIFSTVSSFLLAIAFANLLEPATYGNYKYILSIVGLLTIFTLPGMGTAIIQASARGFEGSFYSAFKEKIKFGAIGSLSAIGLSIYYFLEGNYTLPIPLLISAIFLPLWQASTIYRGFLTSKKLFDVNVKYSTLTSIIYVSVMTVTLFLTKNIYWLVLSYFASNTFLNYFFYCLTKRKLKPNKKEDIKTLSYGKHLSLVQVIGTIAGQLDKILIFHYLGANQVAIYSLAMAPPDQIKGLLKKVQSLTLPKFAPKTKTKIKRNLWKKLLFFLVIVSVITIIYIILAPLVYKIFFPKYLTSIHYSQFFAISLLTTPTVLLRSIFQAKATIKESYYVTLFNGIIKILLMFVLVLLFGLWGIIWAIVISRFLTFFFSLWLVKRM